MNFRIGEGWDVHALVPGPGAGHWRCDHRCTPWVLLGHSDADVLLHAITDALLGAAALGDIGTHFRDTDTQFRGADSLALLTEAAAPGARTGYQIGNIDTPVVAQAPRWQRTFRPCARALRRRWVCNRVGQRQGQTAERLGPVGQGLAMEARRCADTTAPDSAFTGPSRPHWRAILQCAFAAFSNPVYRCAVF